MNDRELRTAALSDVVARARSFLFVPGDRPHVVAKAIATDADVVIVDLEDSVPPENKSTARAALDRNAGTERPTIIRANQITAAVGQQDLQALPRTTVVMVPKATPESVDALRRAYPSISAVALIESAEGVAECDYIAAQPNVLRLAFGHLDLAAELGIDPDDDMALLWARSRLVYTSARRHLPAPIDGITANLTAVGKLGSDTRRAKRLGYGGKLLIHPSQIAPVHAGFAPTRSELDWAHQVLREAGRGVSAVDGVMVDEPVLRRAHNIVASTETGMP
ncbi:CoA ester lyase [Dactylosporangium maewongense]|uniref:CoA ester lyase n=1 Tax=Dactylosporangium maewongense TaxID=634393 RepID=A0ABN2DIN1_9ACTN